MIDEHSFSNSSAPLELSESDEATHLRAAAVLLDEATRSLVAELAPVIEARVARVLFRRRAVARDPRQEVDDITQEVFMSLFEDGGRVLRAWDPSRGLSLENFVGMIAERKTQSILRSGKKSPWTCDPLEHGELEVACGSSPPQAELRLISREKLDRAVARLREELTPRGLELFFRLVIEEEGVASVCASTGMTADAVYAWRSRLSKDLQQIALELSRTGSWGRIPAAPPARAPRT